MQKQLNQEAKPNIPLMRKETIHMNDIDFATETEEVLNKNLKEQIKQQR